MSEPILATRNLGKSFGGIVALDEVDLSIEIGKITARLWLVEDLPHEAPLWIDLCLVIYESVMHTGSVQVCAEEVGSPQIGCGELRVLQYCACKANTREVD